MCNLFSTEVPFVESVSTNLWSLSSVDIRAMTIIEVDVLSRYPDVHGSREFVACLLNGLCVYPQPYSVVEA